MNDAELDKLLDTWHAPAPPRSLRNVLRERFPQADPHKLARPWRWALVILLGSVALAVALAQSSENRWDIPVVTFLNQLYENFLQGEDARRISSIVARIKRSDPRVYVDGRLAVPLEFGPAASMDVQIPGDGVYIISLYRYTQTRNAAGRPTGWVQAGHAHGNAIEFQAGSTPVRIECNEEIVDSDRPVFVRRQR
ncbi:MAG TPA: hypothetical protein VK789_02305 [Bryobacteraceae bacterium]|nr:hypothetical protein [Bryobacteraceae bacterium]